MTQIPNTTDPELEAILTEEDSHWEALSNARTKMRVGLRIRPMLTFDEMTERFNWLNDAQESYKEFSKKLWF